MILFSLLLLATTTFDSSRRIEQLLAIGDHQQATYELQPLLAKDPDNIALQRLEVISLARSNDIQSLLKAYTRYRDHTKGSCDKELLEDVAWAIIKKAYQSSTPIIRSEAIIGAFLSNDAKGIPICLQSICDPSEEMRLLALALAARTHDAALSESAHSAIKHDSSSKVRLEAISCVGSMRYLEAQETLLEILESQASDAHEKMAAVSALSNITKDLDKTLIEQLVASDRAIMRQLACELMLKGFDKNSKLPSLMLDPVFDVRKAAIQCGAILGVYPSTDGIEALLAHNDIKTQILANWLALRMNYKQDKAIANIKRFLELPDRQMRLFASGVASHSGSHIKHFFDFTDDHLVRLNIAIGAMWNRFDVDRASTHLLTALNQSERLSWHHVGMISYIGPSPLSHNSNYIRLPESEDLLCRLELYSMLLATDATSIKEPLKAFLQERTWGISAKSACLMMQENLLCFEELRTLLTDKNQEVALQAAFILSMYAQDEEALKVLETAFSTTSRQMKEYILFAIGSIGSKKSLPFLVQVLNEPFETLRVQAARAILICLYH